MNKSLNLNIDEIEWLSNKITEIDLQNGCPHECIVCASDAPQLSKNMPWNNFMNFLENIQDIKDKNNVDILSSHILPFFSSDPILYLTKNDGVKSIYDVCSTLSKDFSKTISITTAGWNPNNKHIQKGVENIIQDCLDKKMRIDFLYSIKTVSKIVMNEFDKYSKETDKDVIDNFISGSNYTQRTIKNIQTVKPLNTIINPYTYALPFIYEFQFISKENIQNKIFQEKFGKYSKLFSVNFMEKFKDHLYSNGVERLDINYARAFSGTGNALKIGFEPNNNLVSNLKSLNNPSIFLNEEYSASVTYNGILNIYLGNHNSLNKVLVPKSFFDIQAKKSIFNKKRNMYNMLQNLQGRKLF